VSNQSLKPILHNQEPFPLRKEHLYFEYTQNPDGKEKSSPYGDSMITPHNMDLTQLFYHDRFENSRKKDMIHSCYSPVFSERPTKVIVLT